MYKTPKNTIEFKVCGKYALFTDPITKIGGEKCSYHIPTYEAIKGITKSIYWKPSFIWIVDKIRIIKRIQTQTKGIKTLKFSGGNDLSIYTFLYDVEYQVQSHFEWNLHQPNLKSDHIDGKHFEIAKRHLQRGGTKNIFLGTSDCQGYVEPCEFGSGPSFYDDQNELSFGLMFHGFNYPEETGIEKIETRFCKPVMISGIINFPHPNDCEMTKFIRKSKIKLFGKGES